MKTPDYNKLIDAETWAFIERTNAHYPPETARYPIEKQREIYDLMCRAFFAGYPRGVQATDRRVQDVDLRIYESGGETATLLYLHGGGFVVGGLESHDDICAELCDKSGLRVVAVAYRLCPEHRHPAQFEDCRAALGWVRETFAGNIVLAGDSAGANLAAALAQETRAPQDAPPRLTGQVLIYGAYGGAYGTDLNTASMKTHANAPLLTRADVEFYRSVRFQGAEPVRDPSYAPLAAADFSRLPPTVLFAAECDPLCDESRAYHARLQKARTRSTLFVESGLVHGYLRARNSTPRAAASFERIVAAVKTLGAGRWNY